MCVSACQAPGKRTETRSVIVERADPADDSGEPDETTTGQPPQRAVVLPRRVYDPDAWIFVERRKPGRLDAWATGKFDRKRNKLIIETDGVTGFVIDVSRIPINWQRLVVIGIDGKNSELRKRDFTRYHFRRDKYGRWNVMD